MPNVVIVFGSQFGNTKHLAWAMAGALATRSEVRVIDADHAPRIAGLNVDLLFVGAPTQVHGLRLLVRSFLRGLDRRGFAGVPAVAFDTRLKGDPRWTGSEAAVIDARLTAAGCLVVAPPESFVVEGLEGPLAGGEEDRARAWAFPILESMALPVDSSK